MSFIPDPSSCTLPADTSDALCEFCAWLHPGGLKQERRGETCGVCALLPGHLCSLPKLQVILLAVLVLIPGLVAICTITRAAAAALPLPSCCSGDVVNSNGRGTLCNFCATSIPHSHPVSSCPIDCGVDLSSGCSAGFEHVKHGELMCVIFGVDRRADMTEMSSSADWFARDARSLCFSISSNPPTKSQTVRLAYSPCTSRRSWSGAKESTQTPAYPNANGFGPRHGRALALGPAWPR
ncbi:hypothetical protein THAOC_16556 [Thalassiosira oceanica]|uniref:Uncharacterized protein n=1 Tax=Thalassiosira oceanica TaxID=159749 RepID=K0SBW6_THAOC|nr:hypothetical protein THAOC_16556 [Thalassiosira oceanica]|eukprot:EJK62815.1 hypothetical protein THAOC_16556 [Thalassiosira oceanica]